MCWINVNDQKPNPGETVDVWIVNSSRNISGRFADALFVQTAGTTYFAAHVYHHGFEKDGNEVTHWRYPPEPPVRGA